VMGGSVLLPAELQPAVAEAHATAAATVHHCPRHAARANSFIAARTLHAVLLACHSRARRCGESLKDELKRHARGQGRGRGALRPTRRRGDVNDAAT